VTEALELLSARPVLVVDFGAQYAQLIARRVREANIYSEVVPHTMSVADMLAKHPAAVVLSGGPSSVYAEGAPALDAALLTAGVPVFGMCYGFQAMVQALGGTVAHTGLGEYGSTLATVSDLSSTLFHGQVAEQSVWMSHGDSVTEAPAGMKVTASSSGAPVAAFEDDERRLYGVQWHPEVVHSTYGQRVLENFLIRGAGLVADWTPANVVDVQVAAIREQVGSGRVICGLSGGVDSSVAAALVQRAVGDQLTCVFVDHGLLRSGEAEKVEQEFVAATGVSLVVVDARDQFLTALAGVSEPEQKRKIIGRVSSSAASSRPRVTWWGRPTGHAIRSSGWSRGRCIPMSWSPVVARAPPTSSPTTTWAGCRMTFSSSSSNRCGCCSRMRSVRWASSSACPRPSCGASRSPVLASPSASSAR